MRVLAALLWLFLCLPSDAASRFAVCITACTWDASDTTMWSASSGGATGASVPGSSDAVTLDGATCVGGVTCTVTVNATITVQSITFGACTASTTGCILDFSVNNNNVTLSAAGGFSGTGTGTRNLKLGNGTFTLSATSANWNFSTTTNLTFTANSSTISFTGNPSGGTIRQFQSGGLTYSTVTFGAISSGGHQTITGGPAIATLNITAPNYLLFTNSTTTTITNAMTVSGTSGSEVGFVSASVGSTATLSSGSNMTFAWCSFHDITGAGAGTHTASSSFDLGHNSGITITAPSTTSGPNIIGGWLFPANDNTPMFLNKAA